MLDDNLADFQAGLDGVAHDNVRTENESIQVVVEELARERRRYQHLFDTTPDVYITTDINGIIVEANRAAANFLGIRQTQVVGKPLVNFIDTKARRGFRTHLNKLARARKDVAGELPLLSRQTKEPPSFSFHASIYQDVDASRPEIRWVFRSPDVDRQTREQEPDVPADSTSVEDSFHLQPFLNACTTLTQANDSKHLLTTLGQLLSDMLGDYCFISLLDEHGKNLQPVAGGSRQPEYLRMISQFLQGEAQPLRGHVGNKVLTSRQPLVISGGEAKRSGSQTPNATPKSGGALHMLMLPFRPQPKPLGLISIIRNTKQPAYNENDLAVAHSLAHHAALLFDVLEYRQQQADSAWMMAGHSSFLNDVLTDLQAPLHALTGYVSLIQEQAEEFGLDELNTDSHSVESALESSNAILDDLREIVNIEQGLVEPHYERYRIQELLQDIATCVKEKSIRSQVVLDVPGHLAHTKISTDLIRFRQALSGIITSVLNLTHNCRVTCQTREDNIDFIVLCEGKIYGPAVFLQLFNKDLPPQATGRPYRGAGTNLVLAQRIALLLRGNLSIEVTPDGNTIVKMSLPVY